MHIYKILFTRILIALCVGFLSCVALVGVSAPVHAQDNKSLWDRIMGGSSETLPLPARKPDVPNVRALSAGTNAQTIPVSDTLNAKDQNLYRDIFKAVNEGKISRARDLSGQVKNGLLLGHVNAEILLHPAYKAPHEELRVWLSDYADHPQAQKIYVLARARSPSGVSIKEPDMAEVVFPKGNLGRTDPGKTYRSKKKRSAAQDRQVQALEAQIRSLIRKTRPTQARGFLNSSGAKSLLDKVELDSLNALIASGYFYAGYNGQARKLSGEILDRSGKFVPMAGWIYGLSSWRVEDYKSAARGFESAANSEYASGWMISAASYWAGRTHMRLANHKRVSKWLEQSASYPRTFYGLIATRALGRDPVFDWSMPDYGRSERRFISDYKSGLRAAALAQIGQVRLAEAEIKQISPKDNFKDKQSLLAFANHYNLPSLSYRLGNAIKAPDGRLYDAALYPMMAWINEKDYDVDPALVHAFVRQESRFDTHAQSRSGATGLMQIMPATAAHISGEEFSSNAAQAKLRQPQENLKLGQAYLKELLAHPAVDGDLMALAIAYNAGPGNLSKWQRERIRIDEPLLFIETIPFGETRAFVERVLANYWIYTIRFGKDNPSLEAVASGRWARVAFVDKTSEFAQR